MKPYWKFWFVDEERQYFRENASKWFCVESIDGEHWAYIPEDSPETKIPPNQAMGRFLLGRPRYR